MDAEDACATVFLLAKLRKAKQKEIRKRKGSAGFMRYCKTIRKKDCSSLSTLIESKLTNLRSNLRKFLASARKSLTSFDELIQLEIPFNEKQYKFAFMRKILRV